MSTTSQHRYPLAIHSWKPSSGPLIVQCLHSGDIIGTFPLDFVLASGVSSWTYILSVVLYLVDAQDQSQSVLRDAAGAIVEPNDPILPGVFSFEQIGASFTSHDVPAMNDC